MSIAAPGQILRFVGLAAVFFALLYFPYAEQSWPAHVLSAYVGLVARAAAGVLTWFDASVRRDELLILGRFPLQIVLDCTALDVQALYLAAVLSVPASARAKLGGALLGLAVLVLANLARIAALYFVGVYAPTRFDLVHEDVLTFVMLACACATFYGFARWAPR